MCIVYCDICHCRLYSLQNHSEHFVMRNTLAANAGACLSPKGELHRSIYESDMCSEQKPQKVIYNADRQAAPDRQDESVVPAKK